MALGEAIVRVGRKEFVGALKRRLSPPAHTSGEERFTFDDVLSDVQNGIPVRPKPSLAVLSLSLVFLAACIWLIVSSPRLLTSFLIAMALIVPVSLGSLLLMHSKIDRWVNDVADDFSREILRSGKSGR